MYLEDLVKHSYIKTDPATDEEITLLLAGCRPQVDHNLVVSKVDFETVLMENRSTDPTSEVILMAIGRAEKTPSDPIWEVMLKRDCIVSQYTKLCNDEAAARLSTFEENTAPVSKSDEGPDTVLSVDHEGVEGFDDSAVPEVSSEESTFVLPADGEDTEGHEEQSEDASVSSPMFEFETLGPAEDEQDFPVAQESDGQAPLSGMEETDLNAGVGFENLWFGSTPSSTGTSESGEAPVQEPVVSEPVQEVAPPVISEEQVQVQNSGDGMSFYLENPLNLPSYDAEVHDGEEVEDAPVAGVTQVHAVEPTDEVSEFKESTQEGAVPESVFLPEEPVQEESAIAPEPLPEEPAQEEVVPSPLGFGMELGTPSGLGATMPDLPPTEGFGLSIMEPVPFDAPPDEEPPLADMTGATGFEPLLPGAGSFGPVTIEEPVSSESPVLGFGIPAQEVAPLGPVEPLGLEVSKQPEDSVQLSTPRFEQVYDVPVYAPAGAGPEAPAEFTAEPAPIEDYGTTAEPPKQEEVTELLRNVRDSFDLFHQLAKQYSLGVILASEGLTSEQFCLQVVESFPSFGDQYETSLSNFPGDYDRAAYDLIQSLQLEAESAIYAGAFDRAESCIAPVCKLIYT